MRKLLISLLAVFALAACSSGGSDSATEQATPASDAAESTEAGHAKAELAAVTVQTGEVEIAGTLGCGHCTHGIGDGCSAAVQTADGAIYILEDVAEGDDPFDQRLDSKTITVRGESVERDGVGYVTVAGFDL